MATEVKKLQFSEGTDVGAPTDLSLATSTTHISPYASDAAYVSANGTAQEGDAYLNSTTNKFRMYVGSAWRNAVPESDPTDATKLFLVDVSGNSTGVSVSLLFNATTARNYTYPNATGNVVVDVASQTLTNKEMTAPLLDQPVIKGNTNIATIDVATPSDTLNIGASAGTINMGQSGQTVVMKGNMQVDGTTTTVNSTNLEVTDQNITVNNGGNDASAEDAGFTVERTSTNGTLLYEDALASKWKAGAAGSEVELANVSSNQTLTNKRLSLSTTSAANDTTSPRIVLPTNTYANLLTISGANHLAAGAIYWASDVLKAYLWDGSALVEVGSGSGSGGINYITNSDIEVDISGYSTYADAAGLSPVDGTGGSPNITISRNTTTPLHGLADLKISKDAVNRQGEGCSFDFDIDYADSVSPKVQEISFDYRVTSAFDYGTFTTPATDPSDIVVYIYDVTNAQLIQPTPFTLDGSGSFSGKWQNNAGSTSYRLIIHIAGTNASAWDFFADNISVSPQDKAYGPAVKDWETVIMTVSNLPGTVTAKRKIVGDTAEYYLQVAVSGAATGTIEPTLPSGDVIDTSKLAVTAVNYGYLGYAVCYDVAPGNYYENPITYNSTTSVHVLRTASNDYWNATLPMTWANGDYATFHFSVPLVGKSSNTLVSSEADTRKVSLSAFKASGTDDTLATSGTAYKTTWSTISDDSHGAWDATNNRYVVKVAGKYLIHGQLVFGANATGYRRSEIRLNGTGITETSLQAAPATVNSAVPFSHEEKLNVGDYIELWGTQTSGGSLGIVGANSGVHSRFNISKISGPAQIAASEVVAANINRSSNQSINTGTLTVVQFNSSVFDDHNAWDSTNYRYVLPMSGKYFVIAQVAFDDSATGARAISIRKNGTIINDTSIPASGAASADHAVLAQILISGNAGDYIDVQAYQASGGALNLIGGSTQSTYLNIFRLGGVM